MRTFVRPKCLLWTVAIAQWLEHQIVVLGLRVRVPLATPSFFHPYSHAISDPRSHIAESNLRIGSDAQKTPG